MCVQQLMLDTLHTMAFLARQGVGVKTHQHTNHPTVSSTSLYWQCLSEFNQKMNQVSFK